MSNLFRVISLVLFAAVVFFFSQTVAQRGSNRGGLRIYCAAGLQHRIQPWVDEFEKRKGVKIRTRFGGSGELVSLIQLDSSVDIFIGADVQYNQRVEELGLADDSIALMTQSPILLLNRAKLGSEFGRTSTTANSLKEFNQFSLDELLSADLRWSLAKPEHAAIGKIVSDLLSPSVYRRLIDNAIVTHPTVTQVLSDLQSGVSDAGFLWDSMPVDEEKFVSVKPFEFGPGASIIAASIINISENRSLAAEFIEFCARSSDRPVAIGPRR